MRLSYILFLFYLVIEIISLVFFIEEFGFFILFLEIVISSTIGTFILFTSKEELSKGLFSLMKQNLTPLEFFSGNFARIFGAVLLILPGIFGDMVGIVLEIIAFLILDRFFKKQSKKSNENSTPKTDEFIDVEIIEESRDSKKEHHE